MGAGSHCLETFYRPEKNEWDLRQLVGGGWWWWRVVEVGDDGKLLGQDGG